MAEKDQVFKNIDHRNKTKPTSLPNKINDIDTKDSLYANIIDSSINGTLDLSAISSFSTVSQSRNEVYNMLDVMSEDPMISTALSIYAADACEPNDKGQIVWVESDNDRAANMVQHLLDQMNVDKNAYAWLFSLIKYGDLYLRLYRDSEFNDEYGAKDKLNEDVILKSFKKSDHYAEYMEMHKNPAEIFDLQRFGKNVGYIRSHTILNKVNNDIISNQVLNNKYNFNSGDVDIHSAKDFVHACLEDISSRNTEEVSISNDKDKDVITYTVKRGQSILYNVFRLWRELSLLENSVMLNRITKSSIVRTVSVEVGDMEKGDVRALLARIKSMVEQKSAISVGSTFEDYTNPGPIENTIYIPVHDGKGAVTASQIGGDVSVNAGDLQDIEYFRNKMFGALGIPKQYLGITNESTGFNGGSALSLISSQYAKTVKRIQNTFIQAITDAINLILLDKGLTQYINAFTIKMQTPTTQEEKDRKENLSTSINIIRDVMGLVDQVEDMSTKLNILKSLLSSTITDTDVIKYIQQEIDRLEAEKQTAEPVEESDTEIEDEFVADESEPAPMGSEEDFTDNTDVEEVNSESNGESEDLPSLNDLGVDFTGN